MVQYENPQHSDTNHSEVIQFILNPALGQLWDDPYNNFVDDTVSGDVDSFHCHAGVSEEVLKACGALVQ